MKDLELQWVWQTRSLEKFEATALVVDGVLYTLQGPPVQGAYQVVALDAVTGRPFWTLEYKPCRGATLLRPGQPRSRDSRRHAVHGHHRRTPHRDRRQDRHDPLERRSGPLGQKNTEKYAITHAPLVVKDKIIVGMGGGDFGVLGFIAAFDARTGRSSGASTPFQAPGKRATRRGPAIRGRPAARSLEQRRLRRRREPRLLRHRQSRAGLGRRVRRGDNLYSDSVVALDADTGKLKWHYQFTPHDEVDYDSTQVPFVGYRMAGAAAQGMLWANRNGLVYVLIAPRRVSSGQALR